MTTLTITPTTLPDMRSNFDVFREVFYKHVDRVCQTKARLVPRLMRDRMYTAWEAWNSDLKRVEDHEPNITQADHFKHCGHLIFWLRRQQPIVELYEARVAQDAPGYDLIQSEQEVRNFLTCYANEFFAWDVGYIICNYYVSDICAKSAGLSLSPAPVISVSNEFVTNICNMMKFKSVSPHSLYLILAALFEGRSF